MGQILFRPPSVKGWPSGPAWLGSGAIVERLAAAQRIADAATPAARAALADVAFQGHVPARLAEALGPLDGRDRAALLLASPEFQLA